MNPLPALCLIGIVVGLVSGMWLAALVFAMLLPLALMQ
jgi:hypothetical protein